MSKQGFVYFLQDDIVNVNLLKVGFTTNLKERMKDFRTVLPSPRYIAILEGSQDLEENIHDYLKHCGVHSFREWFLINPSEIRGICQIMFDDEVKFVVDPDSRKGEVVL